MTCICYTFFILILLSLIFYLIFLSFLQNKYSKTILPLLLIIYIVVFLLFVVCDNPKYQQFYDPQMCNWVDDLRIWFALYIAFILHYFHKLKIMSHHVKFILICKPVFGDDDVTGKFLPAQVQIMRLQCSLPFQVKFIYETYFCIELLVI